MKKGINYSLSVFFLFILFFSQSVLAVDNAQLSQEVSGTNLPIYRLQSSATGEYLFTYAQEEIDNLVKNGWGNQGIGWYAPRNSRAGTPVYRLYNKKNHIHLYTADKNEMRSLLSTGIWEADFNGDPIFNSGGNKPIYRLFNGENEAHLLTSNFNEYNNFSNKGWKSEGVAFYGTTRYFKQEYKLQPTDITNVECDAAIQADVYMSGRGTGYHSKILIQTPTSAVSFGLQYDSEGLGEFRNKTAFIIENVASNDPGQQTYTRIGYGEDKKWYRLLLTFKKNGTIDTYVNGNHIGQVINKKLTDHVNLSVEGSARVLGDSIDVKFDNIMLKGPGEYDPTLEWTPNITNTNNGFKVYKDGNNVRVIGKITGLGKDEDWDSAYNSVSGVAQYPLSQHGY